jgi:hypothetical protein
MIIPLATRKDYRGNGGETMRESELNGEHIWLRQSVTYTHEGQTRTLEIALPIRPDAPPEEVARLLAQAEAGMAQLTTSLDRRIAGEQVAPPRPAAPDTARRTEPARTTEAASAADAHEAPTPPEPKAGLEVPAPPAAQSSPREPIPAAQPASPAAGIELEMTRPEFIAAIGTLGLNPKEAMDRLGVRSLANLNLHESLETLRRQSLQNDDPQPATPTATPTVSSAPAQAHGEALSAKPDRFDEEDDDALIFEEETGNPDRNESPAPPRQAPGARKFAADAVDDDLDDVPDFGPPPTARARTPERAERPASHSTQIIARLRAALPGGIATADRLTAFTNIIVAELGEPTATALVRGLWKLTPDKLGPEQLDALIRWGKDDTFSAEAEEVLLTLRAEQRARTGAASSTTRGQTQSASSRRRGES